MRQRRQPNRTSTTRRAPAFGDFHDWVLSLPWVVERPYSLATPGVRAFGVECQPLECRKLWLITGLQQPAGSDRVAVSVIVPDDAVDAIEDAGWASRLSPMPERQTLMKAGDLTIHRPQDIEALAITAYSCAMA